MSHDLSYNINNQSPQWSSLSREELRVGVLTRLMEAKEEGLLIPLKGPDAKPIWNNIFYNHFNELEAKGEISMALHFYPLWEVDFNLHNLDLKIGIK